MSLKNRRCLHLIALVLFTPLPRGAFGFTARLQKPWDKFPTVPSSTRFANESRKATRGESSLTARKDQEDDKDESEESTQLKDDDARKRVFVASTSGGVQDVVPPKFDGINGSQAPPKEETPSVRSYLGPLFEMCRPTNFPGVIVLHMLGIHLVLDNNKSQFLATMIHPQMIVTLFVLLGITSTSMVINDYYDGRSGVDQGKNNSILHGKVPPAVVKAFLNYFYASLLVGAAIMPGIASRLSVVWALMLTYWYTKHLKPITWLKNFVCASIMAFAPLASGAAALQLVNKSATLTQLLSYTTLWRLVGVLFSGFMGREIIMDINDVVDDRLHRIRTVPVKYGRRFGARVGLGFTAIMSGLALVGPIMNRQNIKIALAGVGSAMMLFRAFNVNRTEGSDKDVVNKFIEEGKLTLLFLLASFV